MGRKKQQRACDAFSSLNLMIFRAAAESQVSCSATAAFNNQLPAPQEGTPSAFRLNFYVCSVLADSGSAEWCSLTTCKSEDLGEFRSNIGNGFQI